MYYLISSLHWEVTDHLACYAVFPHCPIGVSFLGKQRTFFTGNYWASCAHDKTFLHICHQGSTAGILVTWVRGIFNATLTIALPLGFQMLSSLCRFCADQRKVDPHSDPPCHQDPRSRNPQPLLARPFLKVAPTSDLESFFHKEQISAQTCLLVECLCISLLVYSIQDTDNCIVS